MHAAALLWVHSATAGLLPKSVLDIGGRDINGSPRDLFPMAEYVSVDVAEGAGVDVVADCTTWRPARTFDVVVCCEVAEHLEKWPLLVDCAYEALSSGGLFVFTAAGPGRAPHSAVDGGPVRSGEWYRNIDPNELADALSGFSEVVIDVEGDDVRATARKEG